MLRSNKENESKGVFFLGLMFLLFSLVHFGDLPITLAKTAVPDTAQTIGTNETRQAEQRLWELGYWAGAVDSKFDSASRHALIAFQKVEGRPLTGRLTSKELEALLKASRPLPHFAGYAHIEVDITRQVLLVIDENGIVSRVLPVSTGNESRYLDHGEVHRAHTPRGTFKVSRKINGLRVSSLGALYYPSYILNGVAVHGSMSVPTRPASHGCIRVPMFAAKELSGLMPIGIEVSVYGS